MLINSWGSAEELEFTLRDSDPTVLAADLPRTKLAADALRHRRTALLFSDVDGGIEQLDRRSVADLDVRNIQDAVAAGRGRDYATVQPEPEDMAMLLYTSGSTGHPKGVIYCHISVGQALMHMMLAGFLPLEFSGPIELRGGATSEAGLVTVPLFHATGLFSGFLLPCAVGQKVALLRKWDAETAMQTIQTEKITIIATVPAVLKDLLTHARFDDFDLSSITRVAAAGAATPAGLPELLRDRLGIENRSSGYGMTETTSVCATMSGPVFDFKPMAAGIISPIIDLRAVDSAGNVMPTGSDGEIQLRGVTITPGYWQRDDLTEEAFTPDGWLRTGDLGNVDADGFLHITGRIKEIVIRGGENIAPAEIENVAYRHSSVKEVAVFGVPDDVMGEELVMVFHPQAGSALTEDELRAAHGQGTAIVQGAQIRCTDRRTTTTQRQREDSPAGAAQRLRRQLVDTTTRREVSMNIRRVVTGHDEHGKAVIVDDGVVKPTTVALTPTAYHELWRADSPPTLPDAGTNAPKTTFFPPVGGYRFFLFTFPPGENSADLEGVDIEAGLRELQEKLPGVLETNELDQPGMHTTDTVDMEIVISGEIVLELDDGIETTLRAGDVNIQNGTRHRWHNRGTEPAVMAVAMVGLPRTT